MRRTIASLLGVLVLAPVPAFPADPPQVRLAYDTYAAGMRVMRMHAFFGMGPSNYRIELDYHTTGLVGFFYRGHQTNTVQGIWQNEQPEPLQFFGVGAWHGTQRRTLIDYDRGLPQVKELVPPQQSEREPVPPELQANTIDTLSALAQLMRHVEEDHSCDTTARTYDGRRVLEIAAHTAGEQQLPRTDLSSFSGMTMRCDFQGRELAGFLHGQDDPEHRQPLHGIAWLAPLLPDSPPLPVRISFQTLWFGWATMYLTAAGGPDAALE
jgi:hypothetical protein